MSDRPGSSSDRPTAAPQPRPDPGIDPEVTAPTVTVATGSTVDPSTSSAPASRGWPMPARYTDLGVIDSGAMGTVRRVHDRHLDRTVAMKQIRVERLDEPRVRSLFLAEAKLTARLQHPGIVPVHDWGELPGGQLWFTMKEVRGHTLRHVVRRVHACSSPDGWGRTDDGWTLRRLVAALIATARAVAYAHGESVLHRDLKPGNVMVGSFGEVQVMDWGIAGSTWGDAAGRGSGTLPFMPPEQARGDDAAVGPWSDVYALGAMLFHALAGQSPYAEVTPLTRSHVLRSPPSPVGDATTRPLPDELVSICGRAMAREVAERTPTATAFGDALQGWLDGARRRDQAMASMAEAEEHRQAARDAAGEAETLHRRAEAALGDVMPFDPVEAKAEGWALADEARAAEIREEAAARRVEQALQAALRQAPDLHAARVALADHYRARAERAEARGDAPGLARFEHLLRDHDTGAHAEWLAGHGALDLVTDPADAPAKLWRLVERQRRLEPVFERDLGRTPLRGVPIPRGSWLVTIEAEGRPVVRYPIHIARGERWHGTAPGDSKPYPIWLPGDGDLGPDDIYVPAGWFTAGGDPDALDGLPRRRYWADGFVMDRTPVTHRAYLKFVNHLLETEGEAAAQAHVPGQLGDSDPSRVRLYVRRADGRFALNGSAEAIIGGPDRPLNFTDWHSATAYARWRERRLPHDLEWEKAARGVDTRAYPWGQAHDPAFCAMQKSFSGPPHMPSFEAYPNDLSVYGLWGMGGHVRDMCANGYVRSGPRGPRFDPRAAPDGPYRMGRGGCIAASAAFCRSASRFAATPTSRSLLIGFRTVRSV